MYKLNKHSIGKAYFFTLGRAKLAVSLSLVIMLNEAQRVSPALKLTHRHEIHINYLILFLYKSNVHFSQLFELFL